MSVRYEFADFELDEAGWELRHAGERVELAKRPFELLRTLLRNHHRVVSRSELMRGLWPDVRVSDASLATCLKELRQALEDDGTDQHLIRTVRGKGYRFVAAVRELGVATVFSAPGCEPPSVVFAVPFVGRRELLGKLEAALDAALAGRGRIVLLSGEAGIGKTRTVSEIGAVAATRGARFLLGASLTSEGTPSYWPWVSILRRALAPLSREELPQFLLGSGAVLRGLVPELSGRCSGLPALPRLDPADARFRMFDAVTAFLRRLAEPSGLVVAIDDLQWADVPSLRLLEFLARLIPESRILFVGTYRNAEVDRLHLLNETLAALVRSYASQELRLDGLERDEVSALLESLTGRTPPAADLDRIIDQTEGNPFFVTEVARSVSRKEPQAHAGETVPAGIRLVMRERLRRVSPECDSLLAAASVVGRDFPVDLVGAVAALPSTAVRQASDEAGSAGFLEEVDSSHWRFVHALSREAVYLELDAARRAEQHGRVADELSRRGGVEHHLGQLVDHLTKAGRPVEAVAYARRAGDVALDELAFEDAARYYASALECLDCSQGATAEERCDLLLSRAEALQLGQGEYKARGVALDAARLARRLRDGGRLARAALAGTEAVESVGRHDEFWTDLLRESLDTLGSRSPELRVRLLIHLAAQRSAARDVDEGRALIDEAVRVAQQARDPRSLAIAMSGPLREPNTGKRLADADEAVRLATEVGDPACEAAARRVRAATLLERGRFEESRSEGERWLRLAAEFRVQQELGAALAFASVTAQLQGRSEDAERLATEALSERGKSGNPNALELYFIQVFNLRRDQGRLQEFEGPARTFLTESVSAQAGWGAALAWLLAELGRIEEARPLFCHFVDEELPRLKGQLAWIPQAVVAAEVCVLLGDGERSLGLYDLLLPFEDEITVVNCGDACLGPVRRLLGLLSATRRRWDEAVAHLEAAVSLCGRTGVRTWLAQCQLDLAMSLLARGHPGDRFRGHALLEDSVACASELGMRRLVESAATLRGQRTGTS